MEEAAAKATGSSSILEKVDRSAFAEQTIADAKKALEASQSLDDPRVLEALLAAEKKCRLSNDPVSTKAVATTIVGMCRAQKDWPRLESMLTVLAKRRSQSKTVIAAILAEGLAAVEESGHVAGTSELGDAVETRETLLATLLALTEGRMYCELERAKAARMLATLKERDRSDASAASDVLQLVNAETYGSLSKREKVDFVLEQVRLLLAKQDLVRAYIVSKKIQRKTLHEDDLQDLKTRFYNLMIDYHAAVADDDASAPFELAQHYWNIYDTPCNRDDAASRSDALAGAALFLMLSDFAEPEASDMTHRLLGSSSSSGGSTLVAGGSSTTTTVGVVASTSSRTRDDLSKIEGGIFKRSLELFARDELIHEPTADQAAILRHASLSRHGPERLHKWTALFHTRVVQHNIRVIAKYYKQITMPRLAELLQLAPDDAERQVSHMVSESGLYCKIDRPAGIARFAKPKPPEEILSDWAADINKMLNLVEMTCHLINKENMIHKV
mmetsp:Transcript_18838/g.75139  ORF Transcript_18838/g.75139 Transcript_18838/m.75139 type:complete len:501 (+) Transcript_18838:77-1579(+)